MMQRKKDMWKVYKKFDEMLRMPKSNSFPDCREYQLDSFFPRVHILQSKKHVKAFRSGVELKMRDKLTKNDSYILKWAKGGHGVSTIVVGVQINV